FSCSVADRPLGITLPLSHALLLALFGSMRRTYVAVCTSVTEAGQDAVKICVKIRLILTGELGSVHQPTRHLFGACHAARHTRCVAGESGCILVERHDGAGVATGERPW